MVQNKLSWSFVWICTWWVDAKKRTVNLKLKSICTDSRSPRDGRFIEQIGTYNPTKAEEKVTLDKELAKKWLSNGAQPTDTVRSILSHEGVLKEMHEAKSSK